MKLPVNTAAARDATMENDQDIDNFTGISEIEAVEDCW
jgi:hypothetical protein